MEDDWAYDSSPQRSSPASLPVTPLLGHQQYRHTRHTIIDTAPAAYRPPSSPLGRLGDSRPWTRDSVAGARRTKLARPLSLPKLGAEQGLLSFRESFAAFKSPFLEAEVELAASREERGMLALRLLSALAAQPEGRVRAPERVDGVLRGDRE